MLGTPEEPFGSARRPFGHPGAGGSLAFADPDARLGFAFVMNRMRMALAVVGPRAVELARVTYACL
jgi:CubicO group peptidase (beta-lactamase class C family)